MSTIHIHHGRPRIEQALRAHLSSEGRHDVMQAMGWEKSAVSRFLGGDLGVTIDKIDTLVSVAGFVLVTRNYLDAITTLGKVGVHCECARAGFGECGMSQ